MNFGDPVKGADVFGVLLGRGDKLVGGGLQAAHGGLQAVDITVGEFEGVAEGFLAFGEAIEGVFDAVEAVEVRLVGHGWNWRRHL